PEPGPKQLHHRFRHFASRDPAHPRGASVLIAPPSMHGRSSTPLVEILALALGSTPGETVCPIMSDAMPAARCARGSAEREIQSSSFRQACRVFSLVKIDLVPAVRVCGCTRSLDGCGNDRDARELLGWCPPLQGH